MNLEAAIKNLGFNRVKLDEPMKLHTQMKVGGPVDVYYESKSTKDVKEAVKVAIEENVPYLILGNGANVLVSDKGVKGLIIANKVQGLKFLPHGFVEAESGVDNTELIKQAKDRNLIGTERLLKVPGTVGGAVFMNAGDTGRKRFFGDLVVSVEVIDREGKVKKLNQDECDFGYRSSRFQKTGEVVLKAKLQLKEASREEIEEAAKDILVRKMHHPAGATVGSTFKNPDYDHAGKLIEDCGLKGKRIGGAKISEKHANFIINEGDATATDVKSLIDLMKSCVKEKFGVELQEEVRYIGDWN
ncbi:MAG: UDP-N-acetylenolpyruvoylglucosamine reductase [Candidatus Woykebacteria bacterium RBG_16_43_9]|uniref:UDP-N-acetylenolpyruvoylglucosamine reductase n=1 Tax=Candidatus Woykebacteria bacterium RBG_16_43_9 TaxID=1802596 RepID=A0A1G1WGA5_9BACT|nr:MAG: UDP-N-acetylenolpyruvoylglucosamine reductase [Candidatus Woykebacteria bacterium RBG_16_43_9]